jgi:hypothetical protein
VHRLVRSGQEWQPVAVAADQKANDAGRDLLRLERHAELVAHVAAPLGRAHPEHLVLGGVRPRSAALQRDLSLRGVPLLLRIEQQAVEVEDDGLDLEPRAAHE